MLQILNMLMGILRMSPYLTIWSSISYMAFISKRFSVPQPCSHIAVNCAEGETKYPVLIRKIIKFFPAAVYWCQNYPFNLVQKRLPGCYRRILLTLWKPVVTICTTSLTFSNYTFCPHSVFVCFVWISEQTAIISLYNINWLVFVTEMECVYCAVRTGSLNVI
jgi:hypothetical protein